MPAPAKAGDPGSIQLSAAQRLLRQPPQPVSAAAFARISAAEYVYYHKCTQPLHRAIKRLIQTPAPHLHALLAKIEIIRRQEPEDMTPHLLETLWEDVSRLESERN